MNKKPTIILLLFVSFISLTSSSTYNLFRHPQQSSAKCLDGSPAAMYISQGASQNILIYFQGGGMCYGFTLADTIQYCYNRSKTVLGSSTKYSATKNLDDFTIISNNQQVNPLYYSWTKVYVPYCDGVLHQGTRNSGIQYKGTKLFMRGMNNTLQHFAYLNKKYGLYKAKQIVLSGTSAGAMAAMAWANFIYKNSLNPQGVLVIFDSGQFVSDYLNPFTNSTPGIDAYKSIKSIAFAENQPPFQQCLKVQSKQNCDKFGVLVNYILPPIFAIESEYDLFAINHILFLTCPLKTFPASLQRCNDTQMAVIEDYRQKSMDSWKNLTKDSKNALWAISCCQHGFLYKDIFYNSEYYLVPQKSGKSILETLANFVMRAGKKINIDEAKWPQNQACSGVSNLYTYQQ